MSRDQRIQHIEPDLRSMLLKLGYDEAQRIVDSDSSKVRAKLLRMAIRALSSLSGNAALSLDRMEPALSNDEDERAAESFSRAMGVSERDGGKWH